MALRPAQGGARGNGSFSTRAGALGPARARQAWTIARTELRRAFFAKRGLWVYGLALLPALVFFGHGLDAKWRIPRLSRNGVTDAALVKSIRKGGAVEEGEARPRTAAGGKRGDAVRAG